jgi:hypothetical protein
MDLENQLNKIADAESLAEKVSNGFKGIMFASDYIDHLTTREQILKSSHIASVANSAWTKTLWYESHITNYVNLGLQDHFKIVNAFSNFANVSRVAEIKSSVLAYPELYEKHLSLSEQFLKGFEGVYDYQKRLNLFDTSNFKNSLQLNVFDLSAGLAFSKSFKSNVTAEEGERLVDEAYDDIQQQINSNAELRDDILKLQATIVSIIAGTWRGLKVSANTVMQWFAVKVLHLKHGLSQIAINLISDLIKTGICAVLVCLGFADNSEKKQINNYITNVYTINQINDTILADTTLFVRKSIKTNSIGTISADSIVSLLKINGDWCLVEGKGFTERESTVKNRKRYASPVGQIKEERLLRGWIQKKYLCMFSE